MSERARAAAPANRRTPTKARGTSTSLANLREPRTLLRLALLAAAGLQVAVLAVTVALRIGYPYELELLEGAVLAGVRRIEQHLPLYSAPDLHYVPLNYPPLYSFASAWVSSFVSGSFTPQRIVSVLAWVVAAFAIARLARTLGASRAASFAAVGFLALCYRLGGAWFDVGRADSLQLAFVLVSMLALRALRPSAASIAGTAALVAAALLTKQSALLALLPLALLMLRRAPRAAVPAFAIAAGVVLVVPQLMGETNAHWYAYYNYVVPSFHHLDPTLARGFPWTDVIAPFWPLLLLLGLAGTRREPEFTSDRFALGAIVLGLLAVSWVLRSYPAGYANVLLPLHAAAALVFALAISRLLASGAGRLNVATEVSLTLLAVALQAGVIGWDPRAQIPTRADLESGQELQRSIAAAHAPVWVSTHPYLAFEAGLAEYAHVMPLMDIARDGRDRIAHDLLAAVRDSLRVQHWPALVLDEHDLLTDEAIDAGYHPVSRTFTDDATFWPVTGTHSRPDYILYPAPRSKSLRLREPGAVVDSARTGP